MSDRNEKQNKSSEEEMEESFRDMNVKGKIVTVVGIVLLIVFVIGFVFGLYFFGLVGVFEILGVHYESIWSLVTCRIIFPTIIYYTYVEDYWKDATIFNTIGG